KANDLKPLYRLIDGSFRVVPTLLFKKTLRVDVAKIQRLTIPEGNGDSSGGQEVEVELKGGKAHTLTLLDRVSPLDGKPALLVGFVGQVPAGYKLFPQRAKPNNTFTEIKFEEEKKEEPKKEDKKEEKKDK